MKRPERDEPDSVDSLIVFLLALAWATFSGPPLRSAFGEWSVAAFTFGLFLIPVVASFLWGFRIAAMFRLKLPRARDIAGGLLLAVGMLLAVIVCSVAITALFPELPISGKTFRTNVYDTDVFRLVLSVVIFPAICEEALFRGFILSGIDRGSRRIGSAVLCGILFGLLHMDPVQIPFTAAVGFGLSWIALETESIAVPVFMHAFHNLMLLLIARFGLPRVPDLVRQGLFSGQMLYVCVLLVISILSVVCIVVGLRLAKRRNGRDLVSPESFP